MLKINALLLFFFCFWLTSSKNKKEEVEVVEKKSILNPSNNHIWWVFCFLIFLFIFGLSNTECVLIRKQFVSNYLEFETKNLIEHIFIYMEREEFVFSSRKKRRENNFKRERPKIFYPQSSLHSNTNISD